MGDQPTPKRAPLRVVTDGGPSGERCDGCYFWQKDNGLTQMHAGAGEDFGRCHRRPDVYTPYGGLHIDDWLNWTQPPKIAVGWCGEFRPAPDCPSGSQPVTHGDQA
jgi:hypothetical protein